MGGGGGGGGSGVIHSSVTNHLCIISKFDEYYSGNFGSNSRTGLAYLVDFFFLN